MEFSSKFHLFQPIESQHKSCGISEVFYNFGFATHILETFSFRSLPSTLPVPNTIPPPQQFLDNLHHVGEDPGYIIMGRNCFV